MYREIRNYHQLPALLLKAHWEMADCLTDEIFLGDPENTLYGKDFLYELFLYHASHDPRFHAVGWSRHHKGYMVYTDPVGCEYFAEAAIAAFLGLGMKSERVIINDQGKRFVYQDKASGTALRSIFRPFSDILAFHSWMRWHVQKMRGYTIRYRELDAGYPVAGPRKFPEVVNLINELYPKKD